MATKKWRRGRIYKNIGTKGAFGGTRVKSIPTDKEIK